MTQTSNTEEIAAELVNKLSDDTIKDKQIEILELKNKLVTSENEIASMKVRSMKVYEENQMLKANPDIAARKAEMDYMLSMADRFIKSGAFNVKNPEQAYTIMKAGKEMGLAEVESLNALYIVNGTINFYGKHMVARLTNLGYKIQYLEESNKSLKVRVYKEDGTFDETEKVTDDDQILLKSKAMSFAKKNKMRYHGIRMIINFHLPHHFGSVSDMMTEEYHEVEHKIKPYELEQMRERIQSCDSEEELDQYFQENKAIITKDINLTMEVGKMRKLFSEEPEIIE